MSDAPKNLCDCERGHNGMGLMVRECDCLPPPRGRGLYRLIRPGERIQPGDEGLHDDCERWLPLSGWEVGMGYNPMILVPMRRRMDRDPAPPPAEGDA